MSDFRHTTGEFAQREAHQSDQRPRSVNSKVVRSDDALFTYNDTTITPKSSRSLIADIVGALTGDVTGDVTGNADTATKLATARSIALTGAVTGSASFDGSANISISTTSTSSDVTVNYGSNSNGEYVYVGVPGSTGIQICWERINAASGSTATWTFPRAFASAPNIGGHVDTNAVIAVAPYTISGPSTSSVGIRTNNPTAYPVQAIAIGRVTIPS